MAEAKKLIEMDEKYKMFAEKDTVEEEDLMALEEEEKWVSSEDEQEVEKQRVKVPIVVKKQKRVRNTAMEIDE